VVGFVVQYVYAGTSAELRGRILGLAGTFGRAGFILSEDSRDRIVFERFDRSVWVYIGVVLLFPLGLLLLLLPQRRHHFSFSFARELGATDLVITGAADRDVAIACHRLSEADGFWRLPDPEPPVDGRAQPMSSESLAAAVR
jgi:hypothetical protein